SATDRVLVPSSRQRLSKTMRSARSEATAGWSMPVAVNLRSFERAVQDRLQGDRAVQSGGRRVPAFGNPAALGILPVLAIEEPAGLEARPVDAVETACVDREAVRLRARHIEGVHAAMRAEGVLRHAGAEGVHRERVLAAQQLESLRHHHQMENALLGADRAAAL